MTEVEIPQEPVLSPLEAFVRAAREELEEVQRKLNEITMLVEQSQGEVDKLTQRNAAITVELHQLQANFDTVPREDIRATYEAAQDAQQRLFTMRGQLEKLESDKANLERHASFIRRTLQLLEGGPSLEIADEEDERFIETGIEDVIEAQEEERRKISRQIHDGPAQALSNFILQAEIAMRLFDTDPERAREELANLKEAAASTFSQVRDFIFDLRPMMLDDLGLVPTVRRYTEAFKDKTGLDVSLVATGSERRLEAHREVMVFRAIQELLGNVRDHAQATQAKVMLDMDEHQVRVVVEDNGRGFDPAILKSDPPPGRGLIILQDRIAKMGGELEIDSQEEGGTRIAFAIPSGD